MYNTMNNNMTLETKGGKKYRFIFLLLGIAVMVFCIVFFCEFVVDGPSSMKETGIVLTAVIGCFGMFAILFSFVHCSGYLKIYADRIEGKGLQGKGMNAFCLHKNQVRSVTQESYYLCLHTDIGIFKIICDKESRQNVMRYFAQR